MSSSEALAAELAAGRRDKALALAEVALSEGSLDPLPLRIVADSLRQAGRFDEAIALYGRGTREAPVDAVLWADLGECLFAAQRPEQALAAWDRAIEASGGAAAALGGKARVLHGLGHVEEAGALFRRALALEPASFEAGFGLARLAFEAGRLDEAEALIGPLMAADPDRRDGRWLAARIAFGRGEAEPARALFAGLLAGGRLDLAQRAETLLALGDALDALGRFPEAFAATIEGKAIQRRLFAERAAGREGEVARLTRLAAWFAAADPATWTPAPRRAPPTGREAAGHVFLVGFPRSGTTLLEQVLAGHPDVVALEEAPTLAAHQARFLADDAGCASLARLPAIDADAWRARYWMELAGRGVAARGRVFLDKAPAGTLRLPLVAKLFPGAKVLLAIRDPRDVVLSCLRRVFQINALTYAFTSLEETAAAYVATMELAKIYRDRLTLDLIEVRHETLVEEFDAELARICAFLGLDPHPAMADLAATAARRSVRTPSGPQVRAGLNPSGLAHWRAYAAQLAPVMNILAPCVERLGYGA